MSERVEWFQSTSGRVWAGIAIAASVVGIVLGVIDQVLPLVLGSVLFGLISYSSMLRPKVGADADDLHVRGMYGTFVVPLAGVDALGISRTFAARVAGKNRVSSGLSRGLRESVGRRVRRSSGASYEDIAEDRLRTKVDDARRASGVEHGSEQHYALAETGHVQWAWPEVALTVVVLVAFVASLLV